MPRLDSARQRGPCPNREPVDNFMVPGVGIRKGRCVCGYEGVLYQNGLLHQHSRDLTGFTTPGLTTYASSYEPLTTMLSLCQECGCVVADQDIHDDWHNTLVEDLNLLRKE